MCSKSHKFSSTSTLISIGNAVLNDIVALIVILLSRTLWLLIAYGDMYMPTLSDHGDTPTP